MPSPMYQQFQPQSNLVSMLNQLKQNPVGMLGKRYNIPQDMNDPNQILQHLLNTNQVSQAQVNKVMQMRNDPQLRHLLSND